MTDRARNHSQSVWAEKNTKNKNIQLYLYISWQTEETLQRGIIIFLLFVDEQDNEVVWPRKIRYSNTQEKIKS